MDTEKSQQKGIFLLALEICDILISMFWTIFWAVCLGILAALILLILIPVTIGATYIYKDKIIRNLKIGFIIALIIIIYQTTEGRAVIDTISKIIGWLISIAFISAILDAFFDLGIWHPKRKDRRKASAENSKRL